MLRYFRIAPDRPVFIAASTLKGEEERGPRGLPAHPRARMPNALLIIAPRKPERFDEAERLARRAGWNVARRTELRVDAEPRDDVVILDTIGELAQLFQVATVVFVGGSLVDTAATISSSRPCSGSQSCSVRTCRTSRRSRGRSWTTARPSRSGPARELEPVLLDLLGDPVRRARLGAAARALVEANRGARTKSLAAHRAAAAARTIRATWSGPSGACEAGS